MDYAKAMPEPPVESAEQECQAVDQAKVFQAYSSIFVENTDPGLIPEFFLTRMGIEAADREQNDVVSFELR